jgi:hypothetical protein
MTRRERRIRHYRVRRVLAGVTALGMVGLGVGFAIPAGAQGVSNNDGPGGYTGQGNYNCTGTQQGNAYQAQALGASWNSRDFSC